MSGCGPLGTHDPESESPYGESNPNAKPKKTWTVKRTLISNEVNCIAADSENVWIATAKGVSRWERTPDRWHHYTMEDGLANDIVNAVAIEGENRFGLQQMKVLVDSTQKQILFLHFVLLMVSQVIKFHPLQWMATMSGLVHQTV